MRVLFIYRHFWPDTPPYALMLRSMAGHLAGIGHEVSIWCETPTYGSHVAAAPRSETVDGVLVARLPVLPFWRSSHAVKALDRLLFPMRTLIRAIFRKISGETYDLVITATNPPAINGFFALLTARLFGARFIYHCQDIYPELGALTGLWAANSRVFRIMMRCELWTCRSAHRLVVLCKDMRGTLEARGLPRRRISIINNFMTQGIVGPSPRQTGSSEPYRVIFSGNMGRFQGLGVVLQAARMLQDNRAIEFLLLGGGTEFESLQQRFRMLRNVRFAPGLPIGQAQPIIAAASLGIVCLQPGLVRVAYPSKTLTYLGLGVPVLAVVEHGCELADMIERERVGFVTGTRDSGVIAQTIRLAYDNRRSIEEVRHRAKDLYARRFSRAETLKRWEDLVAGSACPG
ncbi:MAG: glycosyltransferase family 4 protein [Hyphomicrobiales bacterium]